MTLSSPQQVAITLPPHVKTPISGAQLHSDSPDGESALSNHDVEAQNHDEEITDARHRVNSTNRYVTDLEYYSFRSHIYWCLYVLSLILFLVTTLFSLLIFLVGAHHSSPSNALEHKMSFCLEQQNREAPGPRTWRYMAPKSKEECKTKVMNLPMTNSEQPDIGSDDTIVFGHEKSLREYVEPSGVEALGISGELGEDVAQEGVLGRKV